MLGERDVMLRGAGNALLYLVGFLLLGFVIGFALSELGIHNVEIIGYSIVLLVCLLAGVFWGRALARATGYADVRALMLANSVSYGPSIILVAFGLGALERVLVEQRQADIPINVLFEILFTTGTFVIVSLNGLANGIALKSGSLAARLAGLGGLAGALGFLIPTLILDLAGRRVGGPRAAETATMLTNMLVGIIFAAAAAGAILTAQMRRFVESHPNPAPPVTASAD